MTVARGTFLYLTTEKRTVDDFPANATDPDAPRAPTLIHHRPVIELSMASGELINKWNPIDMLDPTRVGYLSFNGYSPTIGWDWSHSNGVIEDPRDGPIIVSIRHLDLVERAGKRIDHIC